MHPWIHSVASRDARGRGAACGDPTHGVRGRRAAFPGRGARAAVGARAVTNKKARVFLQTLAKLPGASLRGLLSARPAAFYFLGFISQFGPVYHGSIMRLEIMLQLYLVYCIVSKHLNYLCLNGGFPSIEMDMILKT